jgi:Trk K+ transport system NAD-binding subunit
MLTPPADLNDIGCFLVCGLGSLGQYCILSLKRFALGDVSLQIIGIDKQPPPEWEVQDLPDLLSGKLIIGDCRDDAVLLQAGIERCRAILLVTSNESVNVEAAIAARRLNPQIRIVMRSSRQHLNQLLQQQLRDFIAFEPTELPASSFALAGLREGILGFFNIADYRFQVVEQTVLPKDYRFDHLPAVQMHKRTYRLLSYNPAPADQTPTRSFYQWNNQTLVAAGDRIAYVELVGQNSASASDGSAPERPLQIASSQIRAIVRRGWRANLQSCTDWLQAQRSRQLVAIGVCIALFLWSLGAVMFRHTLGVSWQQAISMTFILLLGGYGDVFGGLDPQAVPGWVQIVCGVISLASIASVLGVLGLITEQFLSARFDFLRRRLVIPKQKHVVVVGFGRVGQRVAAILREFKQPVVAITEHQENLQYAPQIPLLVGDPIAQLARVNLALAKSVVVVTDDEMLNLEVALMAQNQAQQADRSIGLVIRTYDQRFRNNLLNLLPDSQAFAANELSADAFVGAAFGENILGLFPLNHQTILVTEYLITANDTLVGKSLFQVAYGYGVVPVFHQRANQVLSEDAEQSLFPPDERQLHQGDRLVVLASMNGLRRIEHGDLAPPTRWQLTAQKPLNQSFLHYSGNDLARISGCSLNTARSFMENLPGSIDLFMYDYQASKLQEELGRRLPITLTPLPSSKSS